ncbi:MAG: histidinol dehydrogenase [Phycisphaerales bacterium]|nr:histidinol dehydrogenase [Phycisphaerales bacterium]
MSEAVRILTTTANADPLLPEGIRRVQVSAREAESAARDIIEGVRARGDEALIEFTRRYDGADITSLGIRVSPEEFDAADAQIDASVREALAHAIRNIRTFHESQMPGDLAMVEVEHGVWCGDRFTPLDSVCLYVPRGRGAFASVMCMLGAPAVIAGVPRVAVCTPPGPDGSIDAATLVAARMLGIDEIYRIGGAQAVAAIAFGTQSVPACAKIVGPGNVYVSAARALLADVLDPGAPAGPSESAILCDATADPRNAAWNLLIEAEHGENSCAILVVHDRAYADRVVAEVATALPKLTEQRQTYANEVLARNGGIILTDALETSIAVVNAFAPEHLAIMCREPWDVLGAIRNAGEVLIGDYPIISLGNYAMGVNAILPTGGAARTRSCVSVDDFLKRSSVGYVTRRGYDALAPVVSTMSRDEGFSAHHLAVENWTK